MQTNRAQTQAEKRSKCETNSAASGTLNIAAGIVIIDSYSAAAWI